MPTRLSVQNLAAGSAIIVAAIVLAFPYLPATENNALALSLAAIGLWATGVIPEYITAIGFFTLAMQLGGERMGPAQLMCLLLAAVTVFVLLPLDFLWWRLLGWI